MPQTQIMKVVEAELARQNFVLSIDMNNSFNKTSTKEAQSFEGFSNAKS